jgi:hypothetical protein
VIALVYGHRRVTDVPSIGGPENVLRSKHARREFRIECSTLATLSPADLTKTLFICRLCMYAK